MVKYYIKSNTPSVFQKSTNQPINQLCDRSHRIDRAFDQTRPTSHDDDRRPTTDEKDDDARGCSSGDATRDDDERDGGGGGTTDECGVAKVLRGTCDDYDDDER
jgi:hypothetical protein